MRKTRRKTHRHKRKTHRHKRKTHRHKRKRLDPVIKELKELIQDNPIIRMYFTTMIKQVPKSKKWDKFRLKNVDDLLNKLNHVLTVAPDYNETKLVGTPMSAIIYQVMGTPGGLAAFRLPRVNKQFKKILKKWSSFLNSPRSRYVLNNGPNGWFGKNALKKINMDEYVHDKSKKYYGFKSWNDFFVRKFVLGARPIADPYNNKAIVSPCDFTIYKIQKNVKKHDKFWVKEQPYSLMDMLDNDTKYANIFAGGSIFQAFLNPFNYHRWHSPITGTIVKAHVIQGLYFSERNQQTGFKKRKVWKWIDESIDPNDQDASEGYITTNQTRAVFYIKSPDPKLGIMAFMAFGMVEISTCIINDYIKPGYKIKKGEELGRFQFGGSSACLIFKKGAIKKYTRTKGFCKLGSLIAIAN